jgi:hypothetical protein
MRWGRLAAATTTTRSSEPSRSRSTTPSPAGRNGGPAPRFSEQGRTGLPVGPPGFLGGCLRPGDAPRGVSTLGAAKSPELKWLRLSAGWYDGRLRGRGSSLVRRVSSLVRRPYSPVRNGCSSAWIWRGACESFGGRYLDSGSPFSHPPEPLAKPRRGFLWDAGKLCGACSNSARRIHSLWRVTKLCGASPNSARRRQTLRGIAKLCGASPNSAAQIEIRWAAVKLCGAS